MNTVLEKILALTILAAMLGACGSDTKVPSSIEGTCTTSTLVERAKPDSIYSFHSSGTVKDTQTGLIWDSCLLGGVFDGKNCQEPKLYTWNGAHIAASEAREKRHRGYDDWRVPNAKELLSLMDDGCGQVAMNTTYFQVLYSRNWSSSPASTALGSAWAVNFAVIDSPDSTPGYAPDASGDLLAMPMNTLHRVRLVRDDDGTDGF